MSARFVGQTRYSLFVPDSAAWRASNKTALKNEADYKKYLYDPDRLDFRDKIFTRFLAPSLARAAEGFDVTHIVSFSESLPEKYKDSLRKTAERYPVISLRELPDGQPDWGEAIDHIRGIGEAGVFGRYRLDDDDVLAVDYFSAMARYVREKYVGMVVSFPLGVEAVYSGDHFYNFREAHVPMNSMGLLYVSELKEDGQIVGPQGGEHDKSDRVDPVILDARQFGYFRTNHVGQDNLLRPAVVDAMSRVVESMDKFPAIQDPAVLRDSFPAVAGEVLGESQMFETNRDLGEGFGFTVRGNTSGITVRVDANAPEGIRRNSVALSFEVESEAGKALGAKEEFAGIGTSANPFIGQFAYLNVKPGQSETMVSIFLPEAARIRSVNIIPLVPEARTIEIARVILAHSAESVQLNEKLVARLRVASRSAVAFEKLRAVGERAVPRVRTVMVKFLGQRRTNALLRKVAAKLS